MYQIALNVTVRIRQFTGEQELVKLAEAHKTWRRVVHGCFGRREDGLREETTQSVGTARTAVATYRH
jgi:hypothetical protein